MGGWLLPLRRLVKMELCLMVGGSAAFGYLLYGQSDICTFLSATTGVFFLACGAAALNSIQEREYDAGFRRTADRPLVTGAMSLSMAWIVGMTALFFGLLLLLGTGWLSVGAGIAALVIYNGIYTPLKRTTQFSMLSGGVSGALPPFIGWVAAGGSYTDPVIWSVMALFFLWQPPHFCLLLLEHRELGKPGGCFVHMTTRFSTPKVKQFISIWLASFATVVLFFTTIPGFIHQLVRVLLLLGVLVFTCTFLCYLHVPRRPKYRMLFMALNGYLCCLMVLITIGTNVEV